MSNGLKRARGDAASIAINRAAASASEIKPFIAEQLTEIMLWRWTDALAGSPAASRVSARLGIRIVHIQPHRSWSSRYRAKSTRPRIERNDDVLRRVAGSIESHIKSGVTAGSARPVTAPATVPARFVGARAALSAGESDRDHATGL